MTVSGVGAEWFEGTGSGYAQQPGGATLPPSPPSRPALVDRPPGGDLCHVILGNGGTTWGMADASPPDAGRLAAHPGRPGRRRGPGRGAQPRLPRLRRHRLGVDPRGREIHVPALPQPVRLQPRPEPRPAPLLDGDARAGRPAAARRPGGIERPSRADLPPGEAIVSWVTPARRRARPARSGSSPRSTAGPCPAS